MECYNFEQQGKKKRELLYTRKRTNTHTSPTAKSQEKERNRTTHPPFYSKIATNLKVKLHLFAWLGEWNCLFFCLLTPVIWCSCSGSRCLPIRPAPAWSTAGSRGRPQWRAGCLCRWQCSWVLSRPPCSATRRQTFRGSSGPPCLSINLGLQL